jgi:hypothetical protein
MFNQPYTSVFHVTYPDDGCPPVEITEPVARELYNRMQVTERRIIGGQSVIIGVDSCGSSVRMRLPYGVICSDLQN